MGIQNTNNLTQYTAGDKGVYAKDLNYLLSLARDKISTPHNSGDPITRDKRWSLVSSKPDELTINTGFWWRNGHLCRPTDDYTVLYSDKLDKALSFQFRFNAETPVEPTGSESSFPNGDLTGANAVWYCLFLSSDTSTSNLTTVASVMSQDFSSSPSEYTAPTRYHILSYTRDTVGLMFSGLPTRVDERKRVLGVANWTADGKILNVYDNLINDDIQDSCDLCPWDLMMYDRGGEIGDAGYLYVKTGDVIYEGARLTGDNFTGTSSYFYNDSTCGVQLLESSTNYVYVEYDYTSTPTASINVTDTIGNIVDVTGYKRKLLWTIEVGSAANNWEVSYFRRHLDEDIDFDTGEDEIMDWTFRVNGSSVEVYLPEIYEEYFFNGLYTEPAAGVVLPAGGDWWDCSALSLPSTGLSTIIYISLVKSSPTQAFDVNYYSGAFWSLSNDSPIGSDPWYQPMPLCTITNTSGVYTIVHHRKGIINNENLGGDYLNILINGLENDGLKQASIERSGGLGALQLYNFDDTTPSSLPLNTDPDNTAHILFRNMFSDTLPGTSSLRDLKYCTLSNLADRIADEIFGSGDICAWIETNCDITSWISTYIDCGVIENCLSSGSYFYHYNLLDIYGGGNLDNDHGAYWNNADAVEGEYGVGDPTYTTNNGASIGNSSKSKVIDLDARQLTNSAWTVTDTTVAGLGTGAFVVAGGIDAAKEVWSDGIALRASPTTNKWDDSTLLVTVAGTASVVSNGAAFFGSLATAKLQCQDVATVKSDDENVNVEANTFVNLDPTTDLKINGTAGVTGDGFTKGIKTNDTAFQTAIESQLNDLLAGHGLI